jgi:hypothetical protein
VQAEDAEDEHHDDDETDEIDDAVHWLTPRTNPMPDCALSDYLPINERSDE